MVKCKDFGKTDLESDLDETSVFETKDEKLEVVANINYRGKSRTLGLFIRSERASILMN